MNGSVTPRAITAVVGSESKKMITPGSRKPSTKAALFNVCLGLFGAVVFTAAAVKAPLGEPKDYFGLFKATDKGFNTFLAVLWWLSAASWVVRFVRARGQKE